MTSPFEALAQGYNFGATVKAGEQKSKLSALAGQAYNAAPDQRQGIIGQAMGIDADAGMALDKGLGETTDRAHRSLANAAKMLLETPEQYRPAQYQQIRAGLAKLIPGLPEQYDPSVGEAAKGLVSAYGGADASTPSGLREFQGMTAGLSPEDVMKARRVHLGLDGRASTSGFTQIKFTGADGRERVGSFNGRTGKIDMPDGTSFDPQSGATAPTEGATPAQAPQQPAMQQVKYATDDGSEIPPEDYAAVQAVMRAQSQGKDLTVPGGQPIGGALPPRLDYQNGGNVANAFVGRSPEEQAALTEDAKARVGLQYLPEQERIKTNAAIEQAGGKAEVEARVKRDADLATAAQKKYVDAQTTLGLLDEAEALIGTSTGSRAGEARDAAAALVGKSTQGAQAIAQLQPIAAALTLAIPRMEGPQSDADRLLYQKAAGDFANPRVPSDTRLAALKKMRTLAQKYKSGGGNKKAAPAAGGVDDLLSKYGVR